MKHDTKHQLVLASNNAGKLAELQVMLEPLGFNLRGQGQLGIPAGPEPYSTFIENALAKARHVSALCHLPALADDAGLCVDAFDGQPGVFTADYACRFGFPKGDQYNVTALLEQMTAIEQRRAALVCTLVALRHPDDPEPLIACGRVQGQITHQPIGANGFGFDPVFHLPEYRQTFAEMSTELKNQRSHRGQAARQMVQLIREHWLS